MKYRVKTAVLWVLVMVICIGMTGVHAEEAEKSLLSEIVEDIPYLKAELGGGYSGKTILYDTAHGRSIIQPNEGENKTVIRDREKAVVFYGKYRGKDEYKEYKKSFPELDIGFFMGPVSELGITAADIREHDYQIEISEPEKTEPFLVALAYAGVVDNEVFQIVSVTMLFDEECRPTEVRFHLASEIAQAEQTAYLEEQLTQRFEYIPGELFDEAFSDIRQQIEQIKPYEEVEVIDYIDELSNVVKVADEHFLNVLQAETRELSRKAGWDKKAVFAYLEAVDKKFGQFSRGYEGPQITQEEYLEQLDRIYKTAHLVGSDVYTYMFESSVLKPKKKALLVIDQMGGYLDSYGMLQLKPKDSFYPEMTPHSEFLEDYAESVRMAYEKKNQRYKQLDNQMIHQFRMYIDRHNIEYVRSHFEGRTDYEKLLNYAKEFGFSLYYGEPSRHHNKFSKSEPFLEQKCDKILTPNRLSEFIINVKTGEFVTEWDVLKDGAMQNVLSSTRCYREESAEGEKKIVDTESFNYAPADYVEAHQKLDVLPASPAKKEKEKMYLENSLKKKMKEIWKSPNKKDYKEKYRTPKDYLK